MSFFAKLEQACASFIERAFAKSFPSDVEPAQIARKLVATMEARTRTGDGGPEAPGEYSVFVSSPDYERLAADRAYLERAWADLVREMAARVGVTLRCDPRVVMAENADLPKGAVTIEADGERSAPRYALRTIKGLPPDGYYELNGTMQIGRSDESDIALNDPSVSRMHAVIETEGAAPTVRDLGSTNGTFVNGRRVQTESLRDGDDVRFGNTRMRFVLRRAQDGTSFDKLRTT
jgi:hypothetical protein